MNSVLADRFLPFILLLPLFLSPVCAGSPEITGRVVRIFDGDTLEILDSANIRHRIRLQGIDAPERGQAYSRRSREALSEMVFRKTIRVVTEGKDSYNRVLGQVYIADLWINREMLRAGMAWHYTYYNSDQRLADAEKEARNTRLGLWRDSDPMAPWIFRRLNREKKK